MKKLIFALASLFLFATSSAFAEHQCGTAQILNYLNSKKNKNVTQMLASTKAYARTTSSGCTAKDY